MKPCAFCHHSIHEGENYWKVDEAFLHIGDCYWKYKQAKRLSSWPNAVFRIEFDEFRAAFLIFAILMTAAALAPGAG